MLSRQLAEVGKGWAKRKFGVGKADIRSSFGKLNDPGKPPLSRLGILPRQLRTSPLFAAGVSRDVAIFKESITLKK